jgi:hypothetical protein
MGHARSPGERFVYAKLQVTACPSICLYPRTLPPDDPDKLAWACQQLNRAEQSGRVIKLLEGRLRGGEDLDLDELLELKTAYEIAGRERDALRAGLQDPVPRDPVTTWPLRDFPGGGGGFF